MEQSEPMYDLILASASPRRSELLRLLGIPFRTVVSNAPEDDIPTNADFLLSDPDFEGVAREASVLLAKRKAMAVLKKNPGSVVIGADTVVVTGEQILGKPESFDHAIKMLRTLSGKTHKVFTGVSICGKDRSVVFCSEASVTFFPLDDIQETRIRKYAASGSPMDKAGAYGIQDEGALLISFIEGDYYAVVGLPISRLARELTLFDLTSNAGNPTEPALPDFLSKGGAPVCPD